MGGKKSKRLENVSFIVKAKSEKAAVKKLIEELNVYSLEEHPPPGEETDIRWNRDIRRVKFDKTHTVSINADKIREFVSGGSTSGEPSREITAKSEAKNK